jgi:uncharacterized membrane protein YbhN (UPF0104 family)
VIWPVVRLGGGLAVLAVLLWRFGTGPFADAWRMTTWQTVLAAVLLTAVATAANAWRWRVVASALGAPLTVTGSLAAYYRSQFLNVALPGGIVGDAHRGIRHGRAAGALGVGVRATVWDRVTGQAVQVAALVAALATLPTPLRRYTPLTLVAVAAFGLLAWLVRWLRPGGRRAPSTFVDRDLRELMVPAVVGRVVVASIASTAAHVAVFLLAAATVGVGVWSADLVVIAIAVLVGSAIPVNVAGWGPREGVTAGVFALAGLGPATGLTVSVAFGVLAVVATTPGIVVLLADAVPRRLATCSGESLLHRAPHG